MRQTRADVICIDCGASGTLDVGEGAGGYSVFTDYHGWTFRDSEGWLCPDDERRTKVQHTDRGHPSGTVTWSEHLEAWIAYAKRYHNGQDAETIAKRGGFGYVEMTTLLGREPRTFIKHERQGVGADDA